MCDCREKGKRSAGLVVLGEGKNKSKQLPLFPSGIVLTSPKELNFICYWPLRLQKNVFLTGGDLPCSKVNYHLLRFQIRQRKKQNKKKNQLIKK